METNRTSRRVLCFLVTLVLICGCSRSEPAKARSKKDSPPAKKLAPAQFTGLWKGDSTGPLRVYEIAIEANKFPCKGSVSVLDKKRDAVLEGQVVWKSDGDRLVAWMAGADGQQAADSKQVASVSLMDGKLSGTVTPIFLQGGEQQLQFTGFTTAK